MSQNTSEHKKKFECDQCDKAYVIKDALKKHNEAKHSAPSSDERSKSTEEYEYQQQ